MVSGKILNPIFKSKYFILLLFIFAFLLRLPGINRPEIADEGKAVRAVGKDFYGIVQQLSSEDSQPPLFYFMIKIWGKVSNSYPWLRLLSVIWGALTCVLIYKIGKIIFDDNLGLFAYILAATSPLFIYLSQYLRPYSLGVLETVACVWIISEIIKEKETRRLLFLFSLCGLCLLASLYTVYYSAFVIISLNIFCILYLMLKDRKKLLYWLTTQIIVFILYLPWIPFYLKQMKQLADSTFWHYPALHQVKMGFYIGDVHVGSILKALLSLFHFSDIYVLSTRYSTHFPKMLLISIAAVTPIIIGYVIYKGYKKLYNCQKVEGIIFLLSSVIFLPLFFSIVYSLLGDLGILSPISINVRYFGQSVIFFTFFLVAFYIGIKRIFLRVGVLLLICVVFLTQINYVYNYPFNIYKKLFNELKTEKKITLLVSFPAPLDAILDAKTARQLKARYEIVVVTPSNVAAEIEKIRKSNQFYLLNYVKAEYVLLHSESLNKFKNLVQKNGYVQYSSTNISDLYRLSIFRRLKNNI